MSITISVEGSRVGTELNLSNGNFATLASGLGIEADYCGYIEPHDLLGLLRAYDPLLGVRETVVSGNMVNCGIPLMRVDRYCETLLAIAIEAKIQGKRVEWA